MNKGMLSGCVVRMEDKSAQAGFPACTVTIAGETHRATRPLVYFEQVRLSGAAANTALKLTAGEAILCDDAEICQLTWTDRVSQQPRSQIVTRARSFVRLGSVSTRLIGEHRILEQAVNSFTLRGRLAADIVTKTLKQGQVSEAVVVINLPDGPGQTRPHYLKVECWNQTALCHQKKGSLTLSEVLIKTDSAMIDGQKRHFTVLEARSSAVLVS